MNERVAGWLFLAQAGILYFASPVPVVAQDAAFESPYLHVAVVQVRPNTTDVGHWEAAQRDYVAMSKKARSPRARRVWQTHVGNTSEYRIVTPIDKLSEVENLGAPGSEAEMAVWVARASQCVESRRTLVLENHDDMSIGLAEDRRPVMAELIVREVREGKEEEFQQMRRDFFLPGYRKLDMNGIFVSRVLYGDSRLKWAVVRMYDSWDALDAGRGLMRRTMGDEAFERMLEQSATMSETFEWSLLRYRPDLSYEPE